MISTYDFAFSEQGYNHIKVNKVCQDSSAHYADELMSIAVVADGHGSDNYPRTERGSQFAVDATISAIREFVSTVSESNIDITQNSDCYLEQLAKNILASWHSSVEEDSGNNPFTEYELEKVSDKYKKLYLSGQKLEKAYGTTLIAVCQTSDFWFGLQIGDGKCVCFYDDGSSDEPIPWDENCQSNVTTSICDSDAINEFRYCIKRQNLPIASFIGTDGIDDSYANDVELHSLYRSILSIFAEHGQAVGQNEVLDFLPGLSRKGSGDDVSIAGILKSNIPTEFVAVLKAQCEFANAKSEIEKSEHQLSVAFDNHEYILSAIKKAKQNMDSCIQKEVVAKEAIDSARANCENAKTRFEKASEVLAAALARYHSVDGISIEIDDSADTALAQTPCLETKPHEAIVVLEDAVTDDSSSNSPTGDSST